MHSKLNSIVSTTGTNERNEDASYLIISFLLNTMLLGRSAGKLLWSLAKTCNYIANINQYNWAKETATYLMKAVD